MASLPLSGACKDAGEPWLMCLEVSFPRKRSEFGAKEVGGAPILDPTSRKNGYIGGL